MRYGLTWNNDNHWLPNDQTPLALTVAGMWQVGSPAAPLLAAFKDTLRFLVGRRHSIEHGDARTKAIAAYADLGLVFPVASWPQAWARISALACGVLDILPEEAHSGLRRA